MNENILEWVRKPSTVCKLIIGLFIIAGILLIISLIFGESFVAINVSATLIQWTLTVVYAILIIAAVIEFFHAYREAKNSP